MYLNIAFYLYGKQIKLILWMMFNCVHLKQLGLPECNTMTLKVVLSTDNDYNNDDALSSRRIFRHTNYMEGKEKQLYDWCTRTNTLSYQSSIPTCQRYQIVSYPLICKTHQQPIWLSVLYVLWSPLLTWIILWEWCTGSQYMRPR